MCSSLALPRERTGVRMARSVIEEENKKGHFVVEHRGMVKVTFESSYQDQSGREQEASPIGPGAQGALVCINASEIGRAADWLPGR